MAKKGLVVITGLFLVFFFVSPVAAQEPICSSSGPPQDVLRLKDFLVIGPPVPREGDSVTVSFKLENYGQSTIKFGSQGVFGVATNPGESFFGRVFQNQDLRPNEEVEFQANRSLNKAGVWKIWPSYHLSLATGDQYGPDEWQVCEFRVEAVSTPTPTLAPTLTPVPTPGWNPTPASTPRRTSLPTLAPRPDLSPSPGTSLRMRPPDAFSFVLEGPVMPEAFGDGDEDGVVNYLDECPETGPLLKDYVFENGCVCQDTDGGINPEERGTITFRDRKGEEHSDRDYCADGNNVVEYFCRLDYEEGRGGAELDDFRFQRFCGVDYFCRDGACQLRPGVGVVPSICYSEGGTCGDGIQNQNEEGVDCGGVCPQCNLHCTTGTKYAPADTPCRSYYPDDTHRIDWPWTDDEGEYVCQFNEICHPDLDHVIEEATRCCSLREGAEAEGMPDPNLCREARELSIADCDVLYPWSTCGGLCRKCVALYVIKGLGNYARWMRDYRFIYATSGDCAFGDPATCVGGCVDGDCAYPGIEQAPAEMLINDFQTGVCRDYAEATTTLLRKVGLIQSDLGNFCDGVHCYNLVRLPGEVGWHVVDTTGNGIGIRLGGLPGGYPYDFALDEENWCFAGQRTNGESCESGFVGEHEGYNFDFDRDNGPSCGPGLACPRDLPRVPGWAPTSSAIIGCH